MAKLEQQYVQLQRKTITGWCPAITGAINTTGKSDDLASSTSVAGARSLWDAAVDAGAAETDLRWVVGAVCERVLCPLPGEDLRTCRTMFLPARPLDYYLGAWAPWWSSATLEPGEVVQ